MQQSHYSWFVLVVLCIEDPRPGLRYLANIFRKLDLVTAQSWVVLQHLNCCGYWEEENSGLALCKCSVLYLESTNMCHCHRTGACLLSAVCWGHVTCYLPPLLTSPPLLCCLMRPDHPHNNPACPDTTTHNGVETWHGTKMGSLTGKFWHQTQAK